MKIRSGFVSNSSSASFIIEKKDLDNEQIAAIKDHITFSHDHKVLDADYVDSWDIVETEEKILGSTTMDNFPMWKFLDYIGVDRGVVIMLSDDYLFEMAQEQRKSLMDIIRKKEITKRVSLILTYYTDHKTLLPWTSWKGVSSLS